MARISLNVIAISLAIACATKALAEAGATQQLIAQVRLGESLNREDLVSQALARLAMTEGDGPEMIAARFRLMLRQGNITGARQQLSLLQSLAPNSTLYRESDQAYLLANPELRLLLQQARLLAFSGDIPAAITAYNKVFVNKEPNSDLAVEYWMNIAKQPTQAALALTKLQALHKADPQNMLVRKNLSRLLFSQGKQQESFRLLAESAQDRNHRDNSAQTWYDQIQQLPVSQVRLDALQNFITTFPQDSELVKQARAQLETQKRLLVDPGFIARSKGLLALRQGDSSVAISQLKRALRSQPNDSELTGALAEAYSQQNQRALAINQLLKAIQLDPTSSQRSKWNSLLETNRYWLLIDEGKKQLEQKQLPEARQSFTKAFTLNPRNAFALKGLGDVALAQEDYTTAEQRYQQALAKEPESGAILKSLIELYSLESYERVKQYITRLSSAQKKQIANLIRQLADRDLEKQAEQLERQGLWAQAALIQQQRLKNNPNNPWLAYRLASDLDAAGQAKEAALVMAKLAAQSAQNRELTYIYALYLSRHSRDQEALTCLNRLPQSQWSEDIANLANRLQAQQAIARATALKEQGDIKAAFAQLARQPESDRTDLLLGDWALETERPDQAEFYYKKVLRRNAHNADAKIALAELYMHQNNIPAARNLAESIVLTSSDDLSVTAGMERRLAALWNSIGKPEKARQIFARLTQWAIDQPPSMGSALILRDAGRFYMIDRQPLLAKQAFKDAMPAAQISPSIPDTDAEFTRLTRNNGQDDWLKSSIRSDAGDLYRQQDVNVALGYDYSGSSGTPGYSDFAMQTTMLKVDAPLTGGKVWFQADKVSINAGTLSRGDALWATCGEKTCSGVPAQTADGISLATGWKSKKWQTDIGTTPLGFDIVDMVGGVSYKGDIHHVGYTVNLHRRPVATSLLAFAGQRDPNTHHIWGGVRATGAGINLSYDRGKANGLWASFDADSLNGKNVADNKRIRWMAGYYYKLINEENQRLSVGANNMIWHYDKDLSDYTLGQGGYYSPQKYISLSLPVSWRKRTDNWSWELSSSLSVSHSRTATRNLYPQVSLLRSAGITYPPGSTIRSGQSSNGVGYTAQALIERRINKNWSIGAGVDLQYAKDYTPSHAMISVRYSADGWMGDMDMPLQPLAPYATNY